MHTELSGIGEDPKSSLDESGERMYDQVLGRQNLDLLVDKYMGGGGCWEMILYGCMIIFMVCWFHDSLYREKISSINTTTWVCYLIIATDLNRVGWHSMVNSCLVHD
jgi:hypothetical protein